MSHINRNCRCTFGRIERCWFYVENCPVILEERFGHESRRTRHQNLGLSIFRFRLASSLSACFFLMDRYSCKPSLTILSNIQTTQPPKNLDKKISYDTLSQKIRLEKKHAECSLRWDFSNLLWSCFLLLSASASGSNWNAAPNLAWKHKGQGVNFSEIYLYIFPVARHGCINNKVQIVYIVLRTYLTCQSGLLNLKWEQTQQQW